MPPTCESVTRRMTTRPSVLVSEIQWCLAEIPSTREKRPPVRTIRAGPSDEFDIGSRPCV